MTDIEKKLQEAAENETGLTDEMQAAIAASITDTEQLSACLPLLKDFLDNAKEKTAEADTWAKEYSESKKMWKLKSEQTLALVGLLLAQLKLKSWDADNAKARITSRYVLEADDQFLINLYISDDLRQAMTLLPPFIRTTVTVDKRMLAEHLKNNPELMNAYPEQIHTKENSTATLK